MKTIDLIKQCLDSQDFGDVLTKYTGINYYSEDWIGNTSYNVDIVFDGAEVLLMEESRGELCCELNAGYTCIASVVRVRFAEDIENYINEYIKKQEI